MLGTLLVLTHFILYVALLECKISNLPNTKMVNIVNKLYLSLSLSLSHSFLDKVITEIQHYYLKKLYKKSNKD